MTSFQLEMREVYIKKDGSVDVENPDLDDYYIRLLVAGKFENGKDKKNSIGICWYRAHAMRNGIRVPLAEF